VNLSHNAPISIGQPNLSKKQLKKPNLYEGEKIKTKQRRSYSRCQMESSTVEVVRLGSSRRYGGWVIGVVGAIRWMVIARYLLAGDGRISDGARWLLKVLNWWVVVSGVKGGGKDFAAKIFWEKWLLCSCARMLYI